MVCLKKYRFAQILQQFMTLKVTNIKLLECIDQFIQPSITLCNRFDLWTVVTYGPNRIFDVIRLKVLIAEIWCILDVKLWKNSYKFKKQWWNNILIWFSELPTLNLLEPCRRFIKKFNNIFIVSNFSQTGYNLFVDISKVRPLTPWMLCDPSRKEQVNLVILE